MAGIRPLKPGYEAFVVEPKLGGITSLDTIVPSIKGDIEMDIQRDGHSTKIRLIVPQHTQAQLVLSQYDAETIHIDNDSIKYQRPKTNPEKMVKQYRWDRNKIVLDPGSWSITLTHN